MEKAFYELKKERNQRFCIETFHQFFFSFFPVYKKKKPNKQNPKTQTNKQKTEITFH